VALLVTKLAGDEHDHVDQHPDAQATEGKEHQESCEVLADVEAMCAEDAEQETEKPSR
jgi:hypothetical protein